MSDVPLISLQHVGCSFYVRKSRLSLNKVEALKDVTLDIFEGETLGLIGHNGAGKSTLLQILARILTPTSGKLVIREGISISLLTLQLGFSPELTGRENAILGAMYLGYSRKEAQARLEKILDFAEIGAWADEPTRTYSTGMQARLGFAVALEMAPDIMLIDEILGVGDAYFQKKSSQALIQKMQTGQTTVLVSHSEAALRQLCSRAVWLHGGCTHMLGAPDEVLSAYTNWVNGLCSETADAQGSAMPLPIVHVVIVNHNGAAWNLPCLESLLKQQEVQVRVIFVDNASTDDSLRAVQQYYGDRIEYVLLPTNILFAAGCNKGMEQALASGATHVFLLNNDTIMETDCLSRLVACLDAHPEAAGVQPVLTRMDDPERTASAGCCLSRMGGAWDRDNGRPLADMPQETFPVAGITGGASIWRGDVLRRIGLFEPSFGMYFEDVDLSLRARKAGYALYTEPAARVRHKVSATTAQAPSGFCVQYCQTNALRLILRHWPDDRVVKDSLIWMGITFLALLSNIREKNWGTVKGLWRGLCRGLSFLPKGIWERRKHPLPENEILRQWIDFHRLHPPPPQA